MRSSVLFPLLLMLLFAFCGPMKAQDAPDAGKTSVDLPGRGSQPGGDEGAAVRTVLWAVGAAFGIGALGAAAYVSAGSWGFLGAATRTQMDAASVTLWSRLPFFCLFGGLIAAVFQWAQGANLAHIQALVLGATWPSVLGRVAVGNTGNQAENFVDGTVSAEYSGNIQNVVIKP